jgi:hypothetical protein
MKMVDYSYVLQIVGAFCFGALIGWYLYYINRYRKDDIKLNDLVTLIGALGGATIIALFPAKSDMFGAYGIGLAIGFFGYFAVLVIFVHGSGGMFDYTWFLDGRRMVGKDLLVVPGWTKLPDGTLVTGGDHNMGVTITTGQAGGVSRKPTIVADEDPVKKGPNKEGK